MQNNENKLKLINMPTKNDQCVSTAIVNDRK